MTRTVMPEDILRHAKPEDVAPMVGFLASDAPEVPTGRVFEAGAGFFAELQWRRSDGVFLDISKPISAEDVRASWAGISDMSACTDPVEEDKAGPKQSRQAIAQASKL